jgi:hypothetical protein
LDPSEVERGFVQKGDDVVEISILSQEKVQAQTMAVEL